MMASRYNRAVTIILFLAVAFLVNIAKASEANPVSVHEDVITKPSHLLKPDVLPINARISALFTGSEVNIKQANKVLPQLIQISDNFNAAERYLMHIIQAKLLSEKQQYQQAIKLLNQVEGFEKSIVDEQLNTPLFYQLYLELAENYIQLNNYEQAFIERKNYQDKYKEYLKLVKDARINSLEQKFNTDAKQRQNDLLAAENKIKALQITEIEQTTALQWRNIIILLCTAALFLTLIVRQYKLRAKLKRLSRIDTLTGLINRGSLFYLGQKLIDETAEQQQTLSAVLVDIDQFKEVNELYGHEVGDKVIKVIASLGNETMRSRDLYGRLGNEEFVAILPEANLDEAKAIAQRLSDKITDYPFSELGINEPMSASFGIVNIEQIDHNFDSLIHAANETMVIAKQQGKKQIQVYK